MLDPDFWDRVQTVFDAAADEGITVQITSTYRSEGEQSKLYRQWLKAGKKGIPAAPPGQSYHGYGLAVDFETDPADALQRVGELAEEFGLRWGGHFNDPIHIDAGSVISLEAARKRFNVRNLVAL